MRHKSKNPRSRFAARLQSRPSERARKHQLIETKGARGMRQKLNQEKHGKSEAPADDLFLRRWSPLAFAETPVDIDTLKSIFSAATGRLHRTISSLGDLSWAARATSCGCGSSIPSHPLISPGQSPRRCALHRSRRGHSARMAPQTVSLSTT
jgi:hypothetical protein